MSARTGNVRLQFAKTREMPRKSPKKRSTSLRRGSLSRKSQVHEANFNRLLAVFLLAALCTHGLPGQAATIVIDNNDGPGEGFNDPTPVTPLASNPGITLGEQRLYVFQRAADQWATRLVSSVPIHVSANFDDLDCDATTATLGSAGARTIHLNFSGAPQTNTWYSAALANALSGTDLNPAQADISARFNLRLDAASTDCLGGATWWYGTRTDDPTPGGKVALLPVVFHELAHGLGFQTFANTQTGAFPSGSGSPRPDVWSRFLLDTSTGLTWFQMSSDTERATSATNNPNLVWQGPQVTAEQGTYLSGSATLVVNAPPSIAGTYSAQAASFGPTVSSSGITGNVVAALDPVSPSTQDACSTLSNAAQINGNIALIDRGTCGFTVKVRNAQAAGAIAAIIANNVNDDTPAPMGGSDPLVTIPSYGITLITGTQIRNALVMGSVSVTLNNGPPLAGTQGGYVRMHAPNPLVTGSSVSHFSSDAFPNLLMEPSLNSTLFDTVDLTLALFRDIGWPTNTGGGDDLFANGFEN